MEVYDGDDRGRNRLDRVPAPRLDVEFRPVYLFADEALLEISNRTIYALLHLGWVDAAPVLAVYTKSRGRMSDAYMALIKPFRHGLVYPPWIRSIQRAWQTR